MIQTDEVTDIHPKDAVLNATLNLTDCIYKNIEYGFDVTHEGWTICLTVLDNLSKNKFSAKYDRLHNDTRYSAVAYVKLDGRIYKGEEKSFITSSVQASVTAEVSNVSCNTATVSGKLDVAPDGVFTKSATLYYSSTASTEEALKSSGTKKTLTLDSDGSYNTVLSSLVSNTKYNYVVVAKVDDIELNTEVKSFKTLKIQASVTAESVNVSCYSATISGKLNVASEGEFTKSATLYYSSTASTLEALKSSGTKKNLTLNSDGSYNISLSLLVLDTKYNYVVVAKVDDIELNTEVKSFKTLKIQASVTAESENVSCYSATISGKLNVASDDEFTKSATLYYSNTARTLETLKSGGTKKTLTLDSDGSYSISLSSLGSDTKYNYVVAAKVDAVELNTEVKSFTTLKIQASVTAESVNVSYFTATISGKLNIASEGEFTKSATLYYSSTASTLEALKKSSEPHYVLTLDSNGVYNMQIQGLSDETKYYYCVCCRVDKVEFASAVQYFTTKSAPEIIDLGLSVKWRSLNIGASKPEDYGGYYQWAGTQDVSDTSISLGWSECDICPYHTGTGSRDSGFTKYIPADESSFFYDSVIPDNKTVLDPSDDIAHVKLGSKWRMPTEAEWAELRDNCTWTGTTRNGVSGYKVTSKKSGYTSNSIFLPAAGYRSGNYLSDAGSRGYYWSSSLRKGRPDMGCSMHIISTHQYDIHGENRYSGLSVRPVSE